MTGPAPKMPVRLVPDALTAMASFFLDSRDLGVQAANGGGSPANSRHAMLPAGLAVRLQQGGPLESVAGGLQADSGHDAGAYW